MVQFQHLWINQILLILSSIVVGYFLDSLDNEVVVSLVIVYSSRILVIYVSVFLFSTLSKFWVTVAIFLFFSKNYLIVFFKLYSQPSELNFLAKPFFVFYSSNAFCLLMISRYPCSLLQVFHHRWYFFCLNWKFGGDCFICWKYIFFFNIWLDISTWFVTLAVFCSWTDRRKRSVFQMDVLVKDTSVLLEKSWIAKVYHYECFRDALMISFHMGYMKNSLVLVY